MGRPLRNEAPGLHHVVTRGNNKRAVYDDDFDRTLFCLDVNRAALLNGWCVLAYVVMRNHYHLLISIGEKGMSDGMCRLNHGYAVQFNTRHDRRDHLFGKRFWSRHLTTEAMVRNAARYIVQNPRRAGIEPVLEKYVWSSHRATLGLDYPHITLAVDHLLPFFGTKRMAAVEAYREFCELAPSPAELDDPPPVPGTVPEPSRSVHRRVA